MYKIPTKVTKDIIEMIETVINRAAEDLTIRQQIEGHIEIFKEDYATEGQYEGMKGQARLALLEATAETLGFSWNLDADDAITPLAHTMAEAVIEEMHIDAIDKRSSVTAKRAETGYEDEAHRDMNMTRAPSLFSGYEDGPIPNDMDADAYANTPNYNFNSNHQETTHNPELDDPRLKRVLRKK